MGWTISPALAALAPAMLDYTYAHATSNDSFVTGPSGVGYTNPDTFACVGRARLGGQGPSSAVAVLFSSFTFSFFSDMQSFAALTGAYMNASDLRIVNTIDASDSFGKALSVAMMGNAGARRREEQPADRAPPITPRV